MKKQTSIAIVLAVVLAMTVFGTVFAQGPGQPEVTPGYGVNIDEWPPADGEYGPLHEIMITAFAAEFGITVEELNAKIDAGQTMFEIAEAYGYDAESFAELMTNIRQQAREEAEVLGLFLGRGGRWVNGGQPGFGQGLGNGTCLSEDGTPLLEGIGMQRGGRWNR
ncbi:MAG: hypothetical protein MUO76_13650 [Anaerolineaceae bacterium]|nr:hypothetical protein [Anaerolineaceae bacterium]